MKNMDLLRDKGRCFSSYLLKFLKKACATSEDYWELGPTTAQYFRDFIYNPNGLEERDTYYTYWVFYDLVSNE